MKKLLILLAIIILATLQLNWPAWLVFFHCKPDLLLIFALAMVFYLDFKYVLLCAALAGLVKDVFLPATLGFNMVLFCLWVYLVDRLNRQISAEEVYVRWAVVLIAAFLHNLVLGLASLAGGNIISPVIFLRNLFIVSVYTTLISPAVFKLAKKISSTF